MKRKKILIDGKQITPKEHELISACIRHRQRKGLDDLLGKSSNTIKTQLTILFHKLGVISLTDLTLKARENGYDEKGRYKQPGI